jgi:hypothetical protein
MSYQNDMKIYVKSSKMSKKRLKTYHNLLFLKFATNPQKMHFCKN